jgi:hypothetical protein
VTFSPDGRLLVTGDWNGPVRLWEVATGQERWCFKGHETYLRHQAAVSADGKLLATMSSDAPIFIWDVTGCYGRPPLSTPFSEADSERLWNQLRDLDATAAFTAMRTLMARPEPAVALLRKRLQPAVALEARAVEQLLRELDADDFATRQRSTAALAEAADYVEPLLQRAQERQPTAEFKRRIEHILEMARPGAPERLRESRAIEVLERVGTPAARQLLETLAGGAREARRTREAQSALSRLKGRS